MADATPLRLGVAGLGRAFSVMLPTLTGHPAVRLVAAADTRAEARKRFAGEFSAKAYDTVAALCADPAIDAVYVATPHQFHREHALQAAQAGKHLLIEKPMALTVEDCTAIVDAARRAGVHVVVGHSHSFDAPIRHLRKLIESGAFGKVRMINALNYTDYLYRPRRSEELDTSKGGGAVFNQAAHQVDVVRLVAGAPVTGVRAVTGSWDVTRPTEGAYATLLTFANDVFASLVYSGYGHFDSDEFEGWIGEMGQTKAPYPGQARPRFKSQEDEVAYKNARNYGGADFRPPGEAAAHQHFGTLLVSCDRADLRPVQNGVMIYQDGSSRLDAIPSPGVPRAEVIDELCQAVVHGTTPLHDAAWGLATVEVLMAMLQSARDGRDVRLK
ncbi:MAG TPA: Gfo/Idh/MocA family oxidoreductase [Pseudolabrys sp.]|nr:Gfo/Idh/MocA family oxidoreductase [Pseudolabrys sp.]